MYEKLMVPLDGSKLAESVLPHVDALAKGCCVRSIVLVRVAQPFYIPTATDAHLLSEADILAYEAETKKLARQYLDSIAKQLKYDNVEVKIEVFQGFAADILIDYAKRNNVDLTIIATHGRSGVSRWVFGSTAERILRGSCTPVLMVRAPGCPTPVSG